MDEYLEEGEDLEDAEDYARKARRALTEREAEADLTGIIVQDNDPSSPPNGVFATEQEKEMEEEPLHEIVEEVVVEKSQRPEPGTWAGIALDMVLSV